MEGCSVNTQWLPSQGAASKGRKDRGHQPPRECALKNPLVLELQREEFTKSLDLLSTDPDVEDAETPTPAHETVLQVLGKDSSTSNSLA